MHWIRWFFSCLFICSSSSSFSALFYLILSTSSPLCSLVWLLSNDQTALFSSNTAWFQLNEWTNINVLFANKRTLIRDCVEENKKQFDPSLSAHVSSVHSLIHSVGRACVCDGCVAWWKHRWLNTFFRSVCDRWRVHFPLLISPLRSSFAWASSHRYFITYVCNI